MRARALFSDPQLGQEVLERLQPRVRIPRRRVLKGEVVSKGPLLTHEPQRHVRRDSRRQHVGGELVLLGQVEVQGHVVHGALLVDDPAEQALPKVLEPQKTQRKPGTESAAEAKLLRIQSEQTLKKSGAGARMAQHKNRPFLAEAIRVARALSYYPPIQEELQQPEQRIHHRHERDEEHAVSILQVVDVTSSSPENSQPLRQPNATQRVVLQRPHVLLLEAVRARSRIRLVEAMDTTGLRRRSAAAHEMERTCNPLRKFKRGFGGNARRRVTDGGAIEVRDTKPLQFFRPPKLRFVRFWSRATQIRSCRGIQFVSEDDAFFPAQLSLSLEAQNAGV
eukprot:scaffold6009_cov248-Pinguiococcus_pyrenoidosus.AAC.10